MGTWSTLALLGKLVAPVSAPVALDWQAPSACPSAAAVQQRLAATLVDAPATAARELTAIARVEARADGTYTLALQVSGGGVDDARTLSSGECSELADATVLIVALAADPTVLDRGGIAPPLEPTPLGTVPDPNPTRVPQPPAARVSTDAADGDAGPESPEAGTITDTAREPEFRGRPSRRTAPVRTPVRVGVRALAGVGFSVGPSPTADLGLAAGVWGHLWRAELGVTYWTPQTAQSVSTSEDVRGRVQLWAFEPRGCYLPAVASVEFPLCAGLQIGAVHAVANGTRIVEQLPQRDLWLSAAVGAAVAWRPRAIPRRRLGIWLRAEVHPAIVQAGFATDSGPVFVVPPLGGRAGAGLEVRLR